MQCNAEPFGVSVFDPHGKCIHILHKALTHDVKHAINGEVECNILSKSFAKTCSLNCVWTFRRICIWSPCQIYAHFTYIAGRNNSDTILSVILRYNWVSEKITNKRKILRRSGEGVKGRCLPWSKEEDGAYIWMKQVPVDRCARFFRYEYSYGQNNMVDLK
jgi:hypothetical protein